ncbi:MAG: response regulator [Bacteroidia bacterium]|nr:response regulator [Bacteroidia bacterium]
METPAERNAYNQRILRYEWESLIFLIAEDIDLNYMFLSEALKKTKVQILWALNGQEAVDICKSGLDIDLIITDIQMPVKDGFTATREIHALRPRIPIIAYTAYSYEGVKERMLFAGARECLIKPFDPRQLLIIIRKYLFIS